MIDPVTNRYAEALYGLARSQGVLDSVRSDLQRLSSELREGASLSFVFDERLPLEVRRKHVTAAFASAQPMLQDFVNLLFDKRRVEVLRNLVDAFHRRDLDARGAAEGVVESARPIDSAELARLATALGPRLGKTLTLENRVVPELIGGLRVLVESKMIDASLVGRLEGMRKELMSAPLPSLEA